MTSRSMFASTLASSIALGAGALLAAACKQSAPAEPANTEQAALVNCAGINECKGKSLCHGLAHTCAGMNTCKGQGWIDVSPEECTAKSGKVLYVTRRDPSKK
jgi:uncharacterized membrane protein